MSRRWCSGRITWICKHGYIYWSSRAEARRFRPMASVVSALSSIVANGHQIRTYKRYYGLIRRSDELRPAWASSAYSGRSLPLRAVRLTFPSLAVVYSRACPGRGLPQPGSAISTRPNHPLPRQVPHLQVCQRLKAANKKLLFSRPHVLDAARVKMASRMT